MTENKPKILRNGDTKQALKWGCCIVTNVMCSSLLVNMFLPCHGFFSKILDFTLN